MHSIVSIIEDYVDHRVGDRSTKHVSESLHMAPPTNEAIGARKAMDNYTREFMAEFTETSLVKLENIDPDKLEDEYFEKIPLIVNRTGYGVSATCDLFTKIDTERNYQNIATHIEKNAEPDSYSAFFISLVKQLSTEFNVTPSQAARMGMDFISLSFNDLANSAHDYIEQGESRITASRRALKDFYSSKFGSVIEKTKQFMIGGKNLGQAFGLSLIDTKTQEDNPIKNSLYLDKNDQSLFVEAYHIQDKPYTSEEAQLLKVAFSKDPSLRQSFIVFQMLYVQYCEDYLKKHPERASHPKALETFNPIFFPISLDPIKLAPNPKLLKNMINNWGCSIIRTALLHTQNNNIQIEPQDISNGVNLAKQLPLFRVAIGLFSKTDQDDIISFDGVLKRVCPAENSFTEGGKTILPKVLEKVREYEQKSRHNQ